MTTTASPGAPAIGRRPPPAAGRIEAHHVAAVLLLGLLLVLPILVIVLPLGEAGGHGAGVPILLSWAVLIYSAVRIGVFCWRGRPLWADGFLWGFSYVWLGLAGVAQVWAGSNPLQTPLSTTVQILQFSMILVGFLAFDGGRHLYERLRPARAVPADAPIPTRVLSKGRVLALSLGTIVLSPALIVSLGGLGTLFSNRLAVNEQLQGSGLYTNATNATGGILVTVAAVLPFASLLAILCLWRGRPELRRDAALGCTFAALVVVNVILNNPLSNPRYWVLSAALALVLCLRLMERPTARVALIAAYVLAATLLFPYLDATRTQSFGASAAASGATRPVDFLLAKTDYGSVTDVGITVRYTEDQGYTWGAQLAGAALFWFPRSVWPGKPDNTAALLADESNFPNRNLDTPLWAEGYVDFGLVGTAGVMALFGFLGRGADTALERAARSHRYYATPALLVGVSFIGYESFLLRGSLLQAMAKIVLLTVVLLFLGKTSSVPDAARPDAPGPVEKGNR